MININKKIISLLLVVTIVLSMNITVFATTDYTSGTQVTYVAQGSEAYTITVPANLLPGTGGTVTLQGKWASNRVVTVVAEDSVSMVNSINANDKKTLTVTFDGISEAGSNTDELIFTETVSVSDMSNALFGTWNGHFEYQVSIGTVNGEVVMLEGDGQVVNKFAFPEVKFRSSAPVDELTEVKINGEVVDPDNYIVSEGSTVITLKNNYVESLNLTEDGEQHNIEIVSESGTADAGFTVVNVIPEGGLYITVDKTEYGPGEKFPDAPQPGDMYYYGDYEYCYGYQWCTTCGWWSHIFCFCGPDPVPIDHWGFHVNIDYMDKTEYGLPLAQINGDYISDWTGAFANTNLSIAPEIPNTVTNLTGTFADCRNLTTAPSIPNGITKLDHTFSGCQSLTKLPVIPNSVTDMNRTFSNCHSLTDLSDFVIPSNVSNLAYTFYSCINLTVAPTIPEGVINMDHTFGNCQSLTKPPVIPNSVTNMYATFYQCYSLTDLSEFVIPNSVTELNNTFIYCKSLINAPVIPDSVTNLNATFSGCTALKNAPEIPNSVTNMRNTFECCSSLMKAPVIPKSVTNMMETFASCTSLTGVIEIHANPNLILTCFGSGMIAGITYDKVDFAKQNITLIGSSTMLDEIGATGLNYCTTCNGACQNNH